MKSDVVMTRQQADEWIAHLENIFSVVRLLDAEDIKKRIDGVETDTPVTCQCYSFWNRQEECSNCISIKALQEKSQHTKLEYLGSQIFYVIARYVEIDGKEIPHFLHRSKYEKADCGWYYSQSLKSVQIKYSNPKKNHQVMISFEVFDMIGM